MEHSPARALRWARETYRASNQVPSVIGAVVQLGRCFDLLDEAVTSLLAASHEQLVKAFAKKRGALPRNRGKGLKRRDLDCLVINNCLRRLQLRGIEYDTVRGAFLEGPPAYPAAGFARESHIQIAVRNPTCILGVFRPHLPL